MAPTTGLHRDTQAAAPAAERRRERGEGWALALWMLGCLLLPLLSACGGGSEPVPASTPTAGTPAPLAAPAITSPPADQTVTENGNASFSVTASGTGLSYQWQNSTDGGGTWADLVGATAASLNLSAVPLSRDGERLRVRVSNSAGQVVSAAALLTVGPAGAARAWQAAERLRATDGPTLAGAGPAIAANASGRFIVAWVEVDATTGDRVLLTRRYTPGSGWAPADTVTTWPSGTAPAFHGFSVGLAPDGTAAIVFIGRANLRDSLFGSHQPAGGAWASPTLLEDDDIGHSFSRMALVMDDSGVATAVWGQDFDSFPAVFNTRRALAARMAADGSWGPYVDIDFPAGGGINGVSMPPHLAVNASGDVAVGWTSSIPAGPNAGQYAAATVFTQATGWGTPTLLTSPAPSTGSVLEDIAIAPDGSAAATLHYFPYGTPGAQRSVQITRYLPGLGWDGVLEIDQTTAESLFSRIALTDDGTAVVTWQQASFGGNLLYSNTVPLSSTAGTPAPLSATTMSGQMLRRDAAGRMIAVWGSYETGYRLVSRVRDTAGNWGPQTGVSLAQPVSGFDADQALAVAPDGTAAVVWYSQDGVTGAGVPWVAVYR